MLAAGLALAVSLAAQRPAARKKTPARPPAAPAAPAKAADRWPLVAVRIAGNKVFPAEAITAASELKLGDRVQVADLRRALERLTSTGAFETLAFRYGPEGDGVAVTFEVQEVVDLHPVAFERLPVPDAELMRLLTEKVPLFGPQAPATGAMVKRIAAALEERLGVPVIGRLQSGEGRLVMTFRPAAPPPVIAFVKFEQSQVFRPEELQRAFYQTAVGTFYIESRLHELLDANVRLLFEEKGRLQVRFGPFQTEESKEPAGLVVTVPVQDGDEFRFGTKRFSGHSRLAEKEVARLLRIEEAGLANFALVRQAVADIERRYRRDGFLRAKAGFERTLDEQKKTVDVVIRIQEGDQYSFRNLRIQGLDINAAATVQARWALGRGQPFDDSYPEVFLKRIEEEAMFERLGKTAFRATVDEQARAVDVELQFIGEPAKPPRRTP